MRARAFPKIPVLMAAVFLSLSCGFFEDIFPQTDRAPAVDSGSSGENNTGAMDELTDPRVKAALALRSVRMTLEAAFPGGEADRIQIFIDAEGNQRIEMSTPLPEESGMTPESPEWNVLEIFVVDGSAYTRMGKAGIAESTPEENTVLSEILYDPKGPGMWLILLPEESFTAAGKEAKGGFDAARYSVNGSLTAGAITGVFWVDEPTGALVGANLSLAEAILRPVESGSGGVVTIDFSVEKADVPAITVPV